MKGADTSHGTDVLHADAHMGYCAQKKMCAGCHAWMEGYAREEGVGQGWEVGRLSGRGRFVAVTEGVFGCGWVYGGREGGLWLWRTVVTRGEHLWLYKGTQGFW